MNVEKIVLGTFPVGGSKTGLPCVKVVIGNEGQEMTQNDIVDSIRASYLKLVAFSVNIKENPEVKTIVEGLVGIGYTIVIFTTADDSIEALRNIRNVNFVLTAIVPDEKQNTIDARNLPLLKEGDELVFNLSDVKDYVSAHDFVKSKVITRPTVVFSVENSVEDNDRDDIENAIM